MSIIFLWGEDIPGLAEGLDPKILSRKSPEWEQDMAVFGPWRPVMRFSGRHLIRQADEGADKPVIMVCGRCSSSMKMARHFIEHGFIGDWDSVLAVEQTEGRGQHGRAWISHPGNVYGAWVWPGIRTVNGIPISWRGLLSLLAGYVIAAILQERGIPVRIKWPNDLLIEERKCGGILVEDRPDQIILGIGINISHFPDDHQLRENFAIGATGLTAEGYNLSPLSLWTQLVDSGKTYLNALLDSLEPDRFINLVGRKMAWMGKRVLVKAAQDEIQSGIIAGLAPDGGLILRSAGREKIIYTGSIIPDFK